MMREYIFRGRRIAVEEIEGVLAVMPESRDDSDVSIAHAFGEAAAVPMGTLAEAYWRALENAGWVFVRPTHEVRGEFESCGGVRGADAIQKVFHHPNGRIFVGTDRLSVRLRRDMSAKEARRTLETAGLEIIREFSFAPNLYVVRVRAGRDALQASVELSANPDFIYAEPQFI